MQNKLQSNDDPTRSDWHEDLASAIRDGSVLLSRLELKSQLSSRAIQATQQFPVFVPESFLHRMEPGDFHDPLLRQVLPLDDETKVVDGFSTDALNEAAFRSAPGLLHKYQGRALLVLTGSCAVHCRYCFRRHYPYGDEPGRVSDWQPAIDQLKNDTSIKEVLLSGGDPLMLTDKKLDELLTLLESIPHLQRLRIHSRLPIVLPSRVEANLIDRLRCSRLTTIMVVHANHPNEIQGDCAQTLRRLVLSGLTVLNQSVLLKGINDSAPALVGLSELLINLGVIPYYLHQLDRVSGTAHFEVPVELGKSLVAEMRQQLPGYAVPRYVTEIPNRPHKTVIR